MFNMSEKRIITFDTDLEQQLNSLVRYCNRKSLVRCILQTLYANGEKLPDSANEEKYELKLCAQCYTMKNIEKPFTVCNRCVDGMSNKEQLDEQWHRGYPNFAHMISQCDCERCRSYREMVKLSKLRVNKSGRQF